MVLLSGTVPSADVISGFYRVSTLTQTYIISIRDQPGGKLGIMELEGIAIRWLCQI